MKKLGILLLFLGLVQQTSALENASYFQQLRAQYGTIFNANELIEGLRQKNQSEVIASPPQFSPPERPIAIFTYEPNINDSLLFPDPDDHQEKRTPGKHRKTRKKTSSKAAKKTSPALKKNTGSTSASEKATKPKALKKSQKPGKK